VTLQANATSSTFDAGTIDGQELEVHVVQDATGARTFVWPAAARYNANTPPVIAAGASRRSLVGFRWIGGRWQERYRALDLPA
jgi:hypothetical protein